MARPKPFRGKGSLSGRPAALEAVLAQLAFSLGRRDEVPNRELAEKIAAANDAASVEALVELLPSGTKPVRSDCIKVLYEVGEREPKLIAGHAFTFLAALEDRDNRIQWGAMSALSAVAREVPDELYTALPRIVEAARKGSVITRDHAVRILAALCEHEDYFTRAYRLLLDQLRSAPVNQLPMYAELAQPVVPRKDRRFAELIERRLRDVPQPAKRRRLEKVLRSLGPRGSDG